VLKDLIINDTVTHDRTDYVCQTFDWTKLTTTEMFIDSSKISLLNAQALGEIDWINAKSKYRDIRDVEWSILFLVIKVFKDKVD